jgi:leucyl/phenylalanyl-tRNA--protein transferase
MGESMFSKKTDASKICLVSLVQHLREREFSLFDVQFLNPHLVRFGAHEIPAEIYLKRLHWALKQNCSF